MSDWSCIPLLSDNFSCPPKNSSSYSAAPTFDSECSSIGSFTAAYSVAPTFESDYTTPGDSQVIETVVDYVQLIASKNPVVYLKLGSLNGANDALDSGSCETNGEIFPSADTTASSIVSTTSDGAMKSIETIHGWKSEFEVFCPYTSGAFTVETWIKGWTLTLSSNLVFLGYAQQARETSFMLRGNTNGTISFFSRNIAGGPLEEIRTFNLYDDGGTYYIVGRYQNSTMEIFINGVSVVGPTFKDGSGMYDNIAGNHLSVHGLTHLSGLGFAPNLGGTCTHDEVALYHYALSDASILENYAAGTQ